MSAYVLDASALLALLNQESGHEMVAQAVADGAALSAVNLVEVIAKLHDVGVSAADSHTMLDSLGLEIAPFDREQAYGAGALRLATKAQGLSLGDRACLALAQHLALPALTADRVWDELALEVSVRLIR